MSIDTMELVGSRSRTRRRGWLEYLVPPAMLVVAAAIGVAANMHLGVVPEFAVVVALSLFCLMLVCHLLLRAADAADRAAEEAADRRVGQVNSPMPQPVASEPPSATLLQTYPSPFPVMPPAPLMPEAPPMPSVVAEPEHPPAADTISHDAANSVRDPMMRDFSSQPDIVEPPASAKPAAAVDVAPVGWNYRPVDLKLPTIAQVDVPSPDRTRFGTFRPALATASTVASSRKPLPSATASRSIEAERIDAILKRLAVQIKAGAALEAAASALPNELASTALSGDRAPGVEQGPGPDTQSDTQSDMQPATQPGSEPDLALANAVDALRSTVEAMRTGFSPVAADPATTSTTANQVAAGLTGAEVRLAAVAEALAAERADVFLEPILSLAEEHASHFEVSVRLRTADGEALDPRTWLTGATAASADLLPLLDAVGLRHAAGFALKLERRGREGSVFSDVASLSLRNEQFVTDAAGRHAQGIADRLVLSFAQDEMRGLGPAQIAALGDLARLGFRFALQGVADLDMDFEALQSLGFQFAKLDANVFLKGLECSGVVVPAADIARHFEDLGLRVIVSGIHDSDVRQRVQGFGAALGQGLLFGEPRPIPVGGHASGSIAA